MSNKTVLNTVSITLNEEGIQRLMEVLGEDFEGSAESFKKTITPGRTVACIRFGEDNKLDFLRESIPELTAWVEV